MSKCVLLSACANRIVVNGETFHRAIVPASAKPFNFPEEYGLTEEQVTVHALHVCTSVCELYRNTHLQSVLNTVCCDFVTVSVHLLTLAVLPVFFIQALDVSDHYPVEVLLKVKDSRAFLGGSSITSGNQFMTLFVLSHVAFQILTR